MNIGKLEIKPLEFKELSLDEVNLSRVLFYNPTEIYKRMVFDHFKRHNRLTTEQMFPKIDGICACGCGKKLSPSRVKWHSSDCSNFAFIITCIVGCKTKDAKFFLRKYHGNKCSGCNVEFNAGKEELDHILPVCAGGGACWLNNLQLLCRECHRVKSKNDISIYKEYYKFGTRSNLKWARGLDDVPSSEEVEKY